MRYFIEFEKEGRLTATEAGSYKEMADAAEQRARRGAVKMLAYEQTEHGMFLVEAAAFDPTADYRRRAS